MAAFPFEFVRLYHAAEDGLSVGISRSDQTLVLCRGKDHAFVHPQEMSELIGPASFPMAR